MPIYKQEKETSEEIYSANPEPELPASRIVVKYISVV